MLRSCYRTTMRFFADDATKVVPIRWFFCEPGAKALPFHTAFGSRNWNNNKLLDSNIGEVLGALKTYDRGTNFHGLAGDHYCGSASDFGKGLTAAAAQPYPAVNCCNGVLPDQWCIQAEDGDDLELEDESGCIETEDGP